MPYCSLTTSSLACSPYCAHPVKPSKPFFTCTSSASFFRSRIKDSNASPRHTLVISNAAFHVLAKPKLSYQGVGASEALVSAGFAALKSRLLLNDADAAKLQPPPITKSDDKFLEEGMELVWGSDINLAELNDLFHMVGFPKRDPHKLQTALHSTYATIWVRAARDSPLAKLGQLLGFARASSDGARSATIWDVSVHPEWRCNGLGRAMVERLTASLVRNGIATITLYAEPNVVEMYEKLGFVRDTGGVLGLAYLRKAKAMVQAL